MVVVIIYHEYVVRKVGCGWLWLVVVGEGQGLPSGLLSSYAIDGH
jgi:hypothetical protein